MRTVIADQVCNCSDAASRHCRRSDVSDVSLLAVQNLLRHVGR